MGSNGVRVVVMARDERDYNSAADDIPGDAPIHRVNDGMSGQAVYERPGKNKTS